MACRQHLSSSQQWASSKQGETWRAAERAPCRSAAAFADHWRCGGSRGWSCRQGWSRLGCGHFSVTLCALPKATFSSKSSFHFVARGGVSLLMLVCKKAAHERRAQCLFLRADGFGLGSDCFALVLESDCLHCLV